MDSFVYRWRQISTGKWYIGYHKGTPDDGYICSSYIKNIILAHPKDWTRKILRSGVKSDMVALEHRLLKRLDARNNPRSYNQTNGGGSFVNNGGAYSKNGLDWDLSTTELNKLNSKQIVDLFIQIRDEGIGRRIFKMHKWLFPKIIK